MNGMYVVQYGTRVSALNEFEDYYTLDGRHFAVSEEYNGDETRFFAKELECQPM
jgi:hypothetical protein